MRPGADQAPAPVERFQHRRRTRRRPALPPGSKTRPGCCASGRSCRRRWSSWKAPPCHLRGCPGCSGSSRRSAASSTGRCLRRWPRSSGGFCRRAIWHDAGALHIECAALASWIASLVLQMLAVFVAARERSQQVGADADAAAGNRI